MKKYVLLFYFTAYEYVPDSEIGLTTAPSGSEEDLLADKVAIIEARPFLTGTLQHVFFPQTLSDLDSDTDTAPKIVKELPKVVETKDGHVTKLEVKVTGKPKPVGKWLKQGQEIVSSNEFIIENLDDGTSILTISEVYPDDTGDITYEAHNPLGVAVTTTQLVVESVEGKLTSFNSYKKCLINIIAYRFHLPFYQPTLFPIFHFTQTSLYDKTVQF